MLANIIILLIVKLGELLGKLVYGGRGLRARVILGKKNEPIEMAGALLLIMWLLFLPFATIGDQVWAMSLVIGIPIIYVSWIVVARIRVGGMIRAACEKINVLPEDFKATTPSKPAPKKLPMNSDTSNAEQWKCVCGRMNANYVSNCSCGCSKRSAKETV